MSRRIIDELVPANPEGIILDVSAVRNAAVAPENLAQTPIAAGTGTVAIWSQAVAVSTDVVVTLETDPSFSTAVPSSKRFKGSLQCVASRVGSGALSIESLQYGAGMINTLDAAPTFAVNGNTLELQVTRQSDGYSITPRGTIALKSASTASDPVPDIVALKAAVLADSPTQLYYQDAGLTPASPTTGETVTAQADQSGNAHHLSAAGAAAPTMASDGSLIFTSASQFDAAGSAPTGSSHTFDFSLSHDGTSPSQEVLFTAGPAIMIHNAPSSWAAGTHFVIFNGTNFYDFGEWPSGLHHCTLRLNGTTGYATLTIDGVEGAPVAFTLNAITYAWRIGTATFGPTIHLHGWRYKNAVGTTLEAQHWLDMATVAWGAHD